MYKRQEVDIAIYDLLGQKIRSISKENQNRGRQEIIWNNDLPNGAYFIQIVINGQSTTQKIISKN